MDFLLHSPAAHACLGAGLAGLCGFRAFLPLALLSLLARLQLLAAPHLATRPLGPLTYVWAIALLFAVAMIEMGLDKVPLPPLAVDFVFNPVRILSGALVFAASLAEQGTAPMIVGAVAGAVIAFVAHTARGALKPTSERRADTSSAPFLSLFEDVVVLVASAAVLALPWLGVVIVLFVFYLVYRARVRQRRKYRGLRILKD